MLIFKRTWKSICSGQPVESIIPFVGGCLMVVVSFLPWLRDPLGAVYSAWNLPVNLGWSFQVAFFNYGMLCIVCACYAFSLAYANYRASRQGDIAGSRVTAGLLFLVPVSMFLLQYLYMDLGAVALLAQHKNQMLLAQKHFGYSLGGGLFPLAAFAHISDVGVRFQLLIDQIQAGPLISMLGAWMMGFKRLKTGSSVKKRTISRWLTCAVLFLLFLVVGKAIGGEVCGAMAGNAIAAGNYSNALEWLDRAAFLNPSFNQVSFYHIERGQVLYFMHPNQQSEDSEAYIASLLVNRKDYQQAYQQLFTIWQTNKTTPWVLAQISDTLERLVESYSPAYVQYLPPSAQSIVKKDSGALPWLQLLMQVDPRNAYGQYILGRINYDLGNYDLSKAQLTVALRLSPDADLQSSILTYLAFSDAKQGNYRGERVLLLQAEQLDPNYSNNTAREELSGLH